VSDVKNDCRVWFEAKRGHSCSETADFLLNGVETIDGGLASGWQGGKICEHLTDDKAPDAIIDCSPDDSSGYQFLSGVSVYRRMARTNPAIFHLFSRTGAYVHPKLMYFRNLIVIFVAEMERGVADDPKHRSFASQDLDPFSSSDRSVAPADTDEIDKSFIGDVLNHEADFIRVGFQHYRERFLFSLQCRPSVSICVIVDRIAESAQIV
jgi:hypothetical protein